MNIPVCTKWFYEKVCEQWDKQIEEDSNSGWFDFLMNEAIAENANQTLSLLF